MASLVTDTGLLVTCSVSATVEIATTLLNPEWEEVQFLFCDRLMLAVNAYDEADLIYHIGTLVQPGSFTFADYQPLDILGKYVRITAPQTDPIEDIVWIGYIVGTANERSAVEGPVPAQNKLTGRHQVLKAVGLEYFLDRVQIDSAIIHDTERIQRSIPFNGGQGVSLDADTRTRANRSTAVNANLVYAFAPSDEEGELWKLRHIVDYLLEYFTPKTSGDVDAPTYFNLAAVGTMLDGIAPTLDPEGMTTFQVLNKLLSPQRGFVWWLEAIDDGTGQYAGVIKVDTLATADITLPTAGTIPANNDQQSLDFDKQRDVDDVIVAERGSRIYHQIVTRGARMTSTCTLGNVSTAEVYELIEGWTTELQEEYETASESAEGEANDAFRKAERFYTVYGAFRFSADWDGKSGDGADGERNWTFPVLSDTGSVIDTLPYSLRGVRLLNHTRLKRGWDYENTAEIEETQPTGVEAEYMPTFAIMEVAEERELESEEEGYPGTFPAKFQFVEKMNKHAFEGAVLVSDEINVTYSLHVSQTSPGIVLRANGMQHAAALNNWSEITATETEPQVAYESLRVTTTLEADAYCEGRYPANADLPADVPLQRLVLYVGEEYRLDFLAENTVVDLRDGEPVITNGGILRDDRKALADIARVAYEWYQQDRRPITVRFKQIRNLFRLGMLITTIGEGTTIETVNSVVSVIDYNLRDGIMTIKTNDDDLDLTRVA